MKALAAIYALLALVGIGASLHGFLTLSGRPSGAWAGRALHQAGYLSLGAGAAGFVAVAWGAGAAESLLWAAGAALVVGTLSLLPRRLPGSGGAGSPEDCLLEEAEIVEAVAPGLRGAAEIRRGARSRRIEVRAMREDQAFARGARVRVMDIREGCFLVEPADEQHRVR